MCEDVVVVGGEVVGMLWLGVIFIVMVFDVLCLLLLYWVVYFEVRVELCEGNSDVFVIVV